MNFRITILALLVTALGYSQEVDIFKKIQDDYNKEVKSIEALYNTDFNEWRGTVDLNKVTLDPVRAVKATYDVSLSNRDRIVTEVNKYLGVPYLWGGSTPTAFDCSGLVQWTIKKTHGVNIPRTTAAQYNEWGKSMKKNLSSAKPGDLVYFKTRGSNPVSHVGVYLGDGKFIHAPKRNDVVKTSKLDGYWLEKFVGYVSVENILKK